MKTIRELPLAIKTAFLVVLIATLSVFNLYRAYNSTNQASANINPPDSQAKPIIKGLLLRNGAPPESHRAIINTRVLNVGWKDLQASQGAEISSNNPVDQVIQEVQALNQANPSLNMRLKVRIFAGAEAPDWLKNLEGAPITITDTTDGVTGTIGRFWTPTFGQAYQDLQSKLAAKYDLVPELLDVTVARCMTIYAEPFIRNVSNPDNRTALINAGFTVETDKQCHREQIEAHNVWAQTRSSLAFNPYQVINADGSSGGNDINFTMEMMDYCRTTLGSRCVLENNSIRTPTLGGDYTAMYAKMKAMGPPLFFQTARETRIGDWKQTVQWAIDQGANAVELNNDTDYYFTVATMEELASYDATLEASLETLPPPTSTPTPTPLPPTPTPTLAPTVASLTPMTVKSMSMSKTKVSDSPLTYKVNTRVVIKNSITGAVLQGATVTINLTIPTSPTTTKKLSAVTNKYGAVNLSYQTTIMGKYTSKVTSVTKSQFTYQPTSGFISRSITIP